MKIFKKFVQTLFSVKNCPDKVHKIVMFLGIKILISKYPYKFKIFKNNKKNILLISHDLTKTGAPLMLYDCAKILKEQYNVYLYSLGEGELLENYKDLGIEVKFVFDKKNNFKKYLDEMRKFDFIIVNTIVSKKFADLAKKSKKPYIWYIHETLLTELLYPEYEDTRKILQEHQKNILVVSEYAKKYFKDKYDADVSVLHNFVQDEYTGVPNNVDKVKFAFIGSIDKNKGVDILCKAFSELPCDVANKCELNIIGKYGDEEYLKIVKNFCSEIENIHYRGALYGQERIKVFENTNVFVVPSLEESSSRVVLEACMMGRPVIVTENVGAKYLVSSDNGWVVQVNSVQALRACVENIVNNPFQLEKMGMNARNKYLETSTGEIYRKNVLQIINDFLSENKDEK